MTQHGRGRYWDDFKVGELLVTGRRTVDGGDVSRFAGLSGDFNPLHIDAEFARTTPFGERSPTASSRWRFPTVSRISRAGSRARPSRSWGSTR